MTPYDEPWDDGGTTATYDNYTPTTADQDYAWHAYRSMERVDIRPEREWQAPRIADCRYAHSLQAHRLRFSSFRPLPKLPYPRRSYHA